VFLGERDHLGDPLPEFIGARAQDVPELMSGMLEANDRMRDDGLDPVLQAAATAFGCVYVHPFEDGNGRLHRCLIHHVLAERRFTPTGMVFPVSSVMLDRMDEDLPREIDYLRRHDRALLRIMDAVDMPDRVAENLVMFIRQNEGTLSKNRREAEFQPLTDDEVQRIEQIVADSLEGFGGTAGRT
jgi:Fic family protein